MKKNRLNWALGMSFVALVVAMASICISLKAFSLSDMAYVGAIVAILALLVAILIGWNIYTVLDVKDVKYGIDEKIAAGYIRFSEAATSDLYKELFEILGRNPKISDSSEPFIRYGLLYLESSIHIKRNDTAVIVLRVFTDCIKQKIDLRDNEIRNIKLIISRIKQIPGIDKIEGVVDILHLLDTYVL